ncbi:gliding motility-associated peptidyl-prolyl isomerase GldI [Nonlabens sp. Ci31]|jgi:gliding motility-associated peptidyl-prolyl isomerase|uniref:gliding motility-associated peptidyl-prolyl isomerase GldI n=1 Tax=Nonlabens sp. Ci31 TaxID=2608253 RepID=UPI0014631766|nr:gliding motility-associated peptidyl-prolyl isomerase GldI [Nonlabens sp. Ci31]QJP35310.1 gliding motility-associated peptidyl-prolyl isomerase GldI [Nonlabens sp. Ci31]
MKLLFRTFLIGVLTLSLQSCSKKIEARKPITTTTSSTIQQSIEKNKKLNAAEEQAIENIIKDLDQKFERSANGFYYSFTKMDSTTGVQPKFGDRVTFEYDVIALNGDTIYSKQELSPITKSLDQEYGVFRGMRAALKLMKTDEEMIVFFPSYSAYGYYGDNNRIGANTPFKSRVRLLGINLEK